MTEIDLFFEWLLERAKIALEVAVIRKVCTKAYQFFLSRPAPSGVSGLKKRKGERRARQGNRRG